MKSSFQSNIVFFKYLFLVFLVLASCQKDDPVDEEITIDDPNDPNDDPNDDPTNSTGRFSDYISCSIISTPSAVSLNPTYTKYINCSGIPVVGSDNIPDEALLVASETIEFMLTGLGAIRNRLITGGAYTILYEDGVRLNDVPEAGGLGVDDYGAIYRFDQNANINVLITPSWNLMCAPHPLSGPTRGNYLIHEMAHMFDGGALRQLDSSFQSTLASTFTTARSNNLWDNTYASTNKEEYFAETVMIWYGSNEIGPEGGGDSNRNDIGTRAELQSYDGGVYNLIASKLNNLTDVPGCREPVITGTTANCPESVTDIDGNVYEVVNIGPMCWMKENLKTTRYKDGSPILNIIDNGQWENTANGAWCNYENDANTDELYGKLYNWYAAANPAGLCPEGWHIPSYQELQDLVNYSGGDYKAGNLRTVDYWNSSNGSTNSSGFSALPSGERLAGGNFQGTGDSTFFMSYTATTDSYYTKSVFSNQVPVYSPIPDKNLGSSCRCIKD